MVAAVTLVLTTVEEAPENVKPVAAIFMNVPADEQVIVEVPNVIVLVFEVEDVKVEQDKLKLFVSKPPIVNDHPPVIESASCRVYVPPGAVIAVPPVEP